MNLILIMTDEQAIRAIGAYGNQTIRTPNIDKLASRSVVFDRAYVAQPVCTAARSTIMTGLSPHTTGCTENNIALDESIPTFAEMPGLAEGRRIGYVGKWHLGDEIYRRAGFDEWVSIEDAYREYYRAGKDRERRSDYDAFLRSEGLRPDVETEDGVGMFSRGFAARLPEHLTKAWFVGSRSMDFIERSRGTPYLLVASFLEPHMPFFGPRDQQYPSDKVALPMSYDDDHVDKALKYRLFAKSYRQRGQNGVDLSVESGWRELSARYWGLSSMVDEQVGRILEAVERSGETDRTIIVFTSDHGDMMGAHGLVGKCVMFEEAVRVPLLIAVPERAGAAVIPTARRIRTPVSHVDLVPTILELLDVPVPSELEGISLVSAMNGDTDTTGDDRDVVIEWNGMNSGFGDVLGDTEIRPEWREDADDLQIKGALDDPVRTLITRDGYKYTWSHRGEDALYDLRRDPCEMMNIAGLVESAVIEGYRARIEAWQTRTLDPVVFG